MPKYGPERSAGNVGYLPVQLAGILAGSMGELFKSSTPLYSLMKYCFLATWVKMRLSWVIMRVRQDEMK